MLRTPLLAISALIVAGLASQPALAEDIGPHSKDYVEGKCTDKGTYWDAGDSYGCGYKGGGGMICDKGGTDANGNKIDAWCEETKREDRGKGDSRLPWGLAGLLGLIGLAGLSGRDRRPTPANSDR